MRNLNEVAKLEVLFRELPWLMGLDPVIARASSARVGRLDINVMRTEIVGSTPADENSSESESRGYFVSQGGGVLGYCHYKEEPDTSFIGRLRGRMGLDATKVTWPTQSIAAGAADISDPDSIRFVVVWREFCYSGGRYLWRTESELRVWKLPNNKTMRDLLEELRLTEEVERAAALKELTSELGSMLVD